MTINDPTSRNPLLDLLVDCDSRRVGTRYQCGRSYGFNVFLWRLPLLTFLYTHRLHNSRFPLLHPNFSLPLRTFCIVLIKIIRISNIRSHIAIAVAGPPRAVPKVERMAMYPIRGRNDLEEVPACDFYRWDLGCREPNEVSEKTSNDGSVSDDEEVLLFALELDEGWFKANFEI